MGHPLGFDVGCVEGGGLAGPSGLGQGGQRGGPEAAARPPVEAIVDGGGRTVLARAVLPAAAALEDVQDDREDGAVILAPSAGLVGGHERCDDLPLRVRRPQQLRRGLLRPRGARNYILLIGTIWLLGSDPWVKNQPA